MYLLKWDLMRGSYRTINEVKGIKAHIYILMMVLIPIMIRMILYSHSKIHHFVVWHAGFNDCLGSN